jgi:hypothetical protein
VRRRAARGRHATSLCLLALIDSGAQYRGGTTDITRMWPVGSLARRSGAT